MPLYSNLQRIAQLVGLGKFARPPRRTLLLVDHYVPEPDQDAGSRTILDVIQALQALDIAVVFWPQSRREPAYEQALQARGVELPTLVEGAFDDWFARHGARIDLVLLSRPPVAPVYIETIRRMSRAPVMFFGHDIHSARMFRQAVVLRDEPLRREAEAMEIVERRLWREADVSIYLSDEEAEDVRRREPGASVQSIVPFSFDTFPATRPPPAPDMLLFVAGFAHPPNVDAATWLVGAILPRVRARLPHLRLAIVGSHPTDAVRALAGEGVEVTGYVTAEALRARYLSARAAVVPLRFGAGVKLKVVEALHEGLPLVTTPIGAQGLPGIEHAAVVRGDEAGLADAIVRLFEDDSAWSKQASRQVAYARRCFSKVAAAATLAAAVEQAVRTAAADHAAAPWSAPRINTHDAGAPHSFLAVAEDCHEKSKRGY